MKILVIHLLVLLSGIFLIKAQGRNDDCGVRFEDKSVCACSSEPNNGAVQCFNSNTVEICPCSCMYYDAQLNKTIVGHCLFSCFSYRKLKITNTSYFNYDMCNGDYTTNRHGRFCGSCDKDYGLAVYSYHYISCIPCRDTSYKNWLKYFAVALLPLTAFYILALVLKFNVTSSSLGGIVMIIQCATSPQLSEIIDTQIHLMYDGYVRTAIKIFLTISGMTNLDFFRFLYEPFCLHPSANSLHVLSLDYIVALYPFLLILITYMLVTLYDRNYRLLVWIWKPFKWCIYHYSKQWNIRSSLIEIFATFILLSYVKMLGVSLNMLYMTRTYDISGKVQKKTYLLYDADIDYLGSKHLPFALLALSILTVFVLLPFLLLLLYPCRCFQKCLNYFGWRCQTLHIFMDAFQGSFRTEPRDYRYFSAYFLLLRVLIMVQMQIFPTVFMFYTCTLLALIFATMIATLQPYRVSIHNKIDTILMLILATYFASYITSELLTLLGYHYEAEVTLWCLSVSIIGLVVYLVLLLIWKLFSAKFMSVFRNGLEKWNSMCNCCTHAESIESFGRGSSINESERQHYPPLLGPPQGQSY